MFKEINLRNHSSLHKLFYSLRYAPDIGLRNKRKINYVYECIQCHLRYPRVKRVNTARMRCGKCGGKLKMIINNKEK